MKKNYMKPTSCGLEMRGKEVSAVPAVVAAAVGAAAASAASSAVTKLFSSNNLVERDFIVGTDKVEVVYE